MIARSSGVKASYAVVDMSSNRSPASLDNGRQFPAYAVTCRRVSGTIVSAACSRLSRTRACSSAFSIASRQTPATRWPMNIITFVW